MGIPPGEGFLPPLKIFYEGGGDFSPPLADFLIKVGVISPPLADFLIKVGEISPPHLVFWKGEVNCHSNITKEL